MSIPINDLDVWVLAGQSNMQGCGPLFEALDPDPNVFLFNMPGEWEVAKEPLHLLWSSYAPVHKDLMRPGLPEDQKDWTDAQLAEHERTTRNWGAGLGLAFGKAMVDYLGKPVGLIAAAHGGTSLFQWSQDLKGQGTSSLYGAMLDRIEKAGGKLRGILWYQGESDCNPEAAASYADRFDAWIAAVRQDTGIPDLPVVVVQLSRYVLAVEGPGQADSWDAVRVAQLELPARIPQTATAPAIDLALSDSIHVGTPGLIRLGRRMARLVQALEAGEVNPGPRVTDVKEIVGPLGTPMLEISTVNVAGSWNGLHNASGFAVWGVDGSPLPLLRVVDASQSPDDPTKIRVLMNSPIEGPCLLTYGRGTNPACGVTDEADMALPAFFWKVEK